MRRGELLLLAMFLGNVALGCEDNILTLINELFTGRFPANKIRLFGASIIAAAAAA